MRLLRHGAKAPFLAMTIKKKMKRELRPCIYIMTNKGNTVLYIGVTSNLFKRVAEHKDKMVLGFTNRYNITKLVYYEEFNTMEEAIARDKTNQRWIQTKED